MNGDQHRAMTTEAQAEIVKHAVNCHRCQPYMPDRSIREMDLCVSSCDEAAQVWRDVYWKHAATRRSAFYSEPQHP